MENKISTVKERVVKLVEFKGITKEYFFDKIGTTSANFRGNAKKTPLNSSVIENIFTEFPDLSLEWLLTGRGEMLRNIPKQSNNQSIVGDNNNNCQNVGDNNVFEPENISYLQQIISEKDERIKEKDERISEKDKRILELIEEKLELKQIINELKEK